MKEKISREEILKRLSKYKFVPGHGPDYSRKTDEELLKFLNFFEATFEEAFKEE